MNAENVIAMLAFLVALIVFVMTFPFAVALAVPLRKRGRDYKHACEQRRCAGFPKTQNHVSSDLGLGGFESACLE
jgi:hypothetical protein